MQFSEQQLNDSISRAMRRFPRRLSLLSLVVGVLFGCCLISLVKHESPVMFETQHETFCQDNVVSPAADVIEEFSDEFSNVTGADKFIVPNIVHFIRYNKFELNFVDYLVLKAAMRNHRPDKFYFHTNLKDVEYRGKYWDRVRKDEDIWSRIKVLYLEAPTEIFGQKLNSDEDWIYHHGSDIGRIRVLMQYGGIYLDNDAFVIRSLDKYRKFECAISWDENQFMGTQVIVAHKHARFLALWLNSYQDYRPELWYYNAGERPTTEILYRHPQLIHRVKGKFGIIVDVSLNLYRHSNPKFDWRSLDAIHLLSGHRHYLDPNYNKTPVFDEDNIRTYEYPFGEMARDILDFETNIISRPDRSSQLIIDLTDLDDAAESLIASDEETEASNIAIQQNPADEPEAADEANGSSQQLFHKQLLDYMLNQIQPYGITDPNGKRNNANTTAPRSIDVPMSNTMDINNLISDGIVNSQQIQYLKEYAMHQLQSSGMVRPKKEQLPLLVSGQLGVPKSKLNAPNDWDVRL